MEATLVIVAFSYIYRHMENPLGTYWPFVYSNERGQGQKKRRVRQDRRKLGPPSDLSNVRCDPLLWRLTKSPRD